MDIHGVAPLLQVFDMPTAIHFYRNVLGFTVWASSEPGDNRNWCGGFRLHGAEVMLNTAYEAGPAPTLSRPGAHRLTSRTRACFWVQRSRCRLPSLACKRGPPEGAEGCALRDEAVVVERPDGYGLCFQWPATQETHDAWVKSYGIEAKTIA